MTQHLLSKEDLLAPYMPPDGRGSSAAIELTLIMTPLRCARMLGKAALIVRIGP